MTPRTRTRSKRTILTAEQDAAAAHLRAQGLTYRQIGERLGVAPGTAYESVARAIRAVPVEAVEELRAIECQRLDEVIAKLWDVVHAPHPYVSNGKVFYDIEDCAPTISALSGIVRATESKRKLLGLDAPARQTVTVVTEDAVDAELRRLEREIAQMAQAE